MPELRPVRRALLELHRELLAEERASAERFGGRMSAAEALQAAAEDLRFSWLRTLSELIADLDRELQEPGGPDAAGALLDRARTLIAPPDPGSPFGARYLRALQDHPNVVLLHRDVVAALDAAS